MVERRKKMRTAPTQWTQEDREVFRISVQEALEHFHKGRESYFDGIDPEEHVEHHAELRVSAKRRAWLKEKLWDGLGDGIKRVIQVIVATLAIAALLTILGSSFSDSMRKWLVSLLAG